MYRQVKKRKFRRNWSGLPVTFLITDKPNRSCTVINKQYKRVGTFRAVEKLKVLGVHKLKQNNKSGY